MVEQSCLPLGGQEAKESGHVECGVRGVFQEHDLKAQLLPLDPACKGSITSCWCHRKRNTFLINGPLGNTMVHIVIGLLQTDWGGGHTMSSLTIVSSVSFPTRVSVSTFYSSPPPSLSIVNCKCCSCSCFQWMLFSYYGFLLD